MTDSVQNEQTPKEVDFNEALAKTAEEMDIHSTVAGEDKVEFNPEQFMAQQQQQQEEMLKKIVEGFNSETEDDYRKRLNAYIDYLEARSNEVTEMVLGDKVIHDAKDEPLLDMTHQAVVNYLEVQPALEVLASVGKLPIYFGDLRARIEDKLVVIQYKLASICKLSDEAEQKNLEAIDGNFVYGVTMLFTLQSSNVLKTLVDYHRKGVLDEINRNVYIEALDDNYNTHRDYLSKLGYQQALPVIDSHYSLVKEICLSLPLVEEIKHPETEEQVEESTTAEVVSAE